MVQWGSSAHWKKAKAHRRQALKLAKREEREVDGGHQTKKTWGWAFVKVDAGNSALNNPQANFQAQSLSMNAGAESRAMGLKTKVFAYAAAKHQSLVNANKQSHRTKPTDNQEDPS